MEERLQKIIARAGICSRREAEQLITEGHVTVNGDVVMELGSKADASTDHIKVKGKLLQAAEGHRYILLNKPKGVISTVNDPEGRTSVVDLVRDVKERIYPVGRLDFNTEGVLLLTNDGELANRMLSPTYKCPKTYLVKVAKIPNEREIARLERGITVDGNRFGSCEIEMVRIENNAWLKVVLYEGRNHQVKKMFEHIGHPVSKLRRIAFGFLTAKNLGLGEYRELTDTEIARLKRNDFKPLVPVNAVPFLKELGVKVGGAERARLQRYKDGEWNFETKEERLAKKEAKATKKADGDPRDGAKRDGFRKGDRRIQGSFRGRSGTSGDRDERGRDDRRGPGSRDSRGRDDRRGSGGRDDRRGSSYGSRDDRRGSTGRDDRRGGFGGRDERRDSRDSRGRDDRRGSYGSRDSRGRDDRRGSSFGNRDDRRGSGGGRDDRRGGSSSRGGSSRPGSGRSDKRAFRDFKKKGPR